MADYSVQSEFSLGTGFALSGMIQYEQWKFPALNQTPQSDVTVSFQLIFYPQWHLR